MHRGMTSSDVLDTCLAVQLAQASDILLEDLDGLLAALRSRAEEHKLTPTVGRSHGIHAEPTTFGVKLAGHYAEFDRNRARLRAARTGNRDLRPLGRGRNVRQHRPARRGACGESPGPEPRTDLHPDRTSRPARGLFRDPRRHRVFGGAPRRRNPAPAAYRTARGGGVLFGRSEGLVGHGRTSATPVLTENITGLARLGAGVLPARAGDVALWHERDISHSSVERVIAPTRRPRSISCWRARRTSSRIWSSIPITCGEISRLSAASFIRSACFSPSHRRE